MPHEHELWPIRRRGSFCHNMKSYRSGRFKKTKRNGQLSAPGLVLRTAIKVLGIFNWAGICSPVHLPLNNACLLLAIVVVHPPALLLIWCQSPVSLEQWLIEQDAKERTELKLVYFQGFFADFFHALNVFCCLFLTCCLRFVHCVLSFYNCFFLLRSLPTWTALLCI